MNDAWKGALKAVTASEPGYDLDLIVFGALKGSSWPVPHYMQGHFDQALRECEPVRFSQSSEMALGLLADETPGCLFDIQGGQDQGWTVRASHTEYGVSVQTEMPRKHLALAILEVGILMRDPYYVAACEPLDFDSPK